MEKQSNTGVLHLPQSVLRLVHRPSHWLLVFLNEEELIKFRNSEGWRAGIDGSVAIVEWGNSDNLNTMDSKDSILGFAFGNKGLIANVSLEGSKFILLNKDK